MTDNADSFAIKHSAEYATLNIVLNRLRTEREEWEHLETAAQAINSCIEAIEAMRNEWFPAKSATL